MHLCPAQIGWRPGLGGPQPVQSASSPAPAPAAGGAHLHGAAQSKAVSTLSETSFEVYHILSVQLHECVLESHRHCMHMTADAPLVHVCKSWVCVRRLCVCTRMSMARQSVKSIMHAHCTVTHIHYLRSPPSAELWGRTPLVLALTHTQTSGSSPPAAATSWGCCMSYGCAAIQGRCAAAAWMS